MSLRAHLTEDQGDRIAQSAGEVMAETILKAVKR